MENVSWRKSSYSSNGGENCVEVGQGSDIVAVRDTKDRNGVTLDVPAEAWRVFGARIRGIPAALYGASEEPP
jgi:hypothetical protein